MFGNSFLSIGVLTLRASLYHRGDAGWRAVSNLAFVLRLCLIDIRVIVRDVATYRNL